MQDDLRNRFARLADPTPPEEVRWRPKTKPGPGLKTLTLAYVTAQFVHDRLHSVFPAEWHLATHKLGTGPEENGIPQIVYKAVLIVGGVTRESVGSGDDDKSADSDAFKRAAARFGVGGDLHRYPKNFVPYGADPWESHRQAVKRAAAPQQASDDDLPYEAPGATAIQTQPIASRDQGMQYAPIPCPQCGARMWDNSMTRKPNHPLYRCTKNRDHVLWERPNSAAARSGAEAGFPEQLVDGEDDLPF